MVNIPPIKMVKLGDGLWQCFNHIFYNNIIATVNHYNPYTLVDKISTMNGMVYEIILPTLNNTGWLVINRLIVINND